MIDKEHILSKIERIVNRRLNLLQGEYFNLEEETKGMTNELVDILCSIEPTIEALRMEYEKGRADVIAKACQFLDDYQEYPDHDISPTQLMEAFRLFMQIKD
jgi:hypothetical protein